MQQFYSTATHVDIFMEKLVKRLARPDIRFTADSAMAITSLCREGCARTLQDKVREAFPNIRSFSALGGLPNLGSAELSSALERAPVRDGRQRYVFIAMPHIAIDAEGNVGSMTMPGGASADACTSLLGCLD